MIQQFRLISSMRNENDDSFVFRQMEIATFAGGCFWRLQTIFSQVPGVVSTVVGYSGGSLINPTYSQVRTGTTGHAESIQITFDSRRISFEQLLKIFFSSHDSTQLNRQGPDIGTQYRSMIFVHNDRQWHSANAFVQQLRTFQRIPVVTQIVPFEHFYPAESYHQFYEFRLK